MAPIYALLVLWRVGFGDYRCRDFLKTKHFEDEEKTVRVKQQLPEMVKLHDVWKQAVSLDQARKIQ
jgi:hypothetical protein